MKLALTSDFHGYLPAIPPCDAVLIAGDILPAWMPSIPQGAHIDRARSWLLREFFPWADALGVPTYFTWGNHDAVGMPRWAGTNEALWASCPSNLHLVVDAAVDVLGHKTWFSPWSPTFFDWSFMDDDTEEGLGARYAAIPDDVEIVVSHCPPKFCHDRPFGTGPNVGSIELLKRMDWLSKMRLLLCGHIHGSYGRTGWGHDVLVVNASHVDERYVPVNEPVIFDWDSMP